MNDTIQFYADGEPLVAPQLVLVAAMKAACLAGIDPDDMVAVTCRLIRDEEARETFEEWTGIESVVSNSKEGLEGSSLGFYASQIT